MNSNDSQHFRRCVSAFLVCGFVWMASGCSRASQEAPAPAPSSSTTGTETKAPVAGPEELALVAPLQVGGSLADFEVAEIQAVHRGVLNVICHKGRTQVRLWIALASEKGPEPPAKNDKYAVFYYMNHGDPADGERLAKALVEIIGKHSDVSIPKGMTEFVPTAIPI